MANTELTGRVAIVTGAGTGIGFGIAVALAEAGADLVLHYRGHGAALERFAARWSAAGRRVEVVRADFSADPASAADLVDSAVERLGRVDILVNNAAVTTGIASFEEMTRELLDETLRVNVVATFLATQAAARHMMAAGNGGRIINIGSIHGRQAAPGFLAYEASKGAVHSLTYSSAVALGQHGITVNCVAPGTVVVERYEMLDWDEAWALSRTPVQRMGTPADIAALVVFLAGDEAGFITGETIFVDGGLTRRMALVK